MFGMRKIFLIIFLLVINIPFCFAEEQQIKETYKLQGQVLHAKVFGFIHPSTGEYLEFDSQLPDYFEELLEKLRKEAL